MMKNPVMFVVEVVAALTTVIFIRDWVTRRRASRLHLPDHRLAVVHRAVRQLRRSRGRRPRQGAGRDACARPARRPWPSSSSMQKHGLIVPTPAGKLGPGQIVLVEAGDLIPSDGEVIEGVASVNEAAITGESAPVIRESRRRPLGGHRRHAGGLRLAQGAHHRGARLDLPRPHDRAGRRRRAAEDAERDRAQHPARRHDDHLRLRHGDRSRALRPMPAARSRSSCWWRCS